jgi:hypothetical protein
MSVKAPNHQPYQRTNENENEKEDDHVAVLFHEEEEEEEYVDVSSTVRLPSVLHHTNPSHDAAASTVAPFEIEGRPETARAPIDGRVIPSSGDHHQVKKLATMIIDSSSSCSDDDDDDENEVGLALSWGGHVSFSKQQPTVILDDVGKIIPSSGDHHNVKPLAVTMSNDDEEEDNNNSKAEAEEALQSPHVSFRKQPDVILDVTGRVILSSGDHHQVRPLALIMNHVDDDEDENTDEALGSSHVSFRNQPEIILDVTGRVIPSSGDHHQVRPFAMVLHNDEEEEDGNGKQEPLGSPHVSFRKHPDVILDVIGKLIPSSGDHHQVKPFATNDDDCEERSESSGKVSFKSQPAVILDVVGKVIPSSGDHHRVTPFYTGGISDDDDEDEDERSEHGSVSFRKKPIVIIDDVGKIIPSSGDHHQVSLFASEDDDEQEKSESGSVSFRKRPMVIVDVVGKVIPSSGDHHKVRLFGNADSEDDEEQERSESGSVSFRRTPVVILDDMGKIIPSSGDHHEVRLSATATATADSDDDDEQEKSDSGSVSFHSVSMIILDDVGKVISSSGDHHNVRLFGTTDNEKDDDEQELSQSGHVSFRETPAVILDDIGRVIPSSGDHHEVSLFGSVDCEEEDEEKTKSGSVSFRKKPTVILDDMGKIIPSSGDRHKTNVFAVNDSSDQGNGKQHGGEEKSTLVSLSNHPEVILGVEGKVIPCSADRPAPHVGFVFGRDAMGGGDEASQKITKKVVKQRVVRFKPGRVSFREKSEVIFDIEGKVIASSGERRTLNSFVVLDHGDQEKEADDASALVGKRRRVSFSKADQMILDIEGKVIPSSGDRPAPNPFAIVMDGEEDGEEEVKGQEEELEGVKRRRVSFSEKSAVILDIEGKIIASSGDKPRVSALGGADEMDDPDSNNSGATGKRRRVSFSSKNHVILDVEGKVIPSSGNNPSPKAFRTTYSDDSDEVEDSKKGSNIVCGGKRRRVSFCEASTQAILNVDGRMTPSSSDRVLPHGFHEDDDTQESISNGLLAGGACKADAGHVGDEGCKARRVSFNEQRTSTAFDAESCDEHDDKEYLVAQINPSLLLQFSHEGTGGKARSGAKQRSISHAEKRVTWNEEQIKSMISLKRNRATRDRKRMKFDINISRRFASALLWFGAGVWLTLLVQDWDFLCHSVATMDIGRTLHRLGSKRQYAPLSKSRLPLQQQEELYPWKFKSLFQILNDNEITKGGTDPLSLSLMLARIDYLVNEKDQMRVALSECMLVEDQCRPLISLPTEFLLELKKHAPPNAPSWASGGMKKEHKGIFRRIDELLGQDAP